MFLFIYGKGDKLINSRNPTVNTVTFVDKRGVNEEGGKQEQISIGELGLNFAFAVTGAPFGDYRKKRVLHDEKFVEWYTRYRYYDEKGKQGYLLLTHHICNQEDWKKFYQPNFKQRDQINFYKENKFLICLDENQKDLEGKVIKLSDIKLYGKDYKSSSYFDIVYRPCYPKKWTKEREEGKEKCLFKNKSDEDMKPDSKFMKKRKDETMAYL
jgi:hypothetical protein